MSSVGFCVRLLLFIRAHFYVLLVFVAMCSVFWLLLVKLSVLAKCLARRTPPRTPLRGKEIISTKPRPKSVHDFRFNVLFHSLTVYDCLVPGPT